MIKIIFSDVDGTLLNSAHVVTPLTRRTILELKDIPFVIVSARSPSGIYPIQKKNGFEGPIISYSGALIQDEKRRIIYQQGMETSLAEEILRFIESEKLPLTWCLYSGDQWIVKDKSDPKVRREEAIVEAQAQEGTVHSVPDGGSVHKILCICDLSNSEDITADAALHESTRELIEQALDKAAPSYEEYCRSLEENLDIDDITITVEYIYNTELIAQRTFESD